MQTFIATAASIADRWADIDGNLDKIRAAAQRAAHEHSRLLLLPECCLTGADWPQGLTRPPLSAVALPLDSPPLDELVRIARQTGVIIAAGLYEKLRGRVFITQAFAGPRGLLGAYRKVHQGELSSREREKFPVFDLGFARAGVSTCFDNMFPECARILALRGAEVLLSPFASLPLTRPAWRLERLVALRARAQDNRLFVLSASHAEGRVQGSPPEWGYSGICCAINPLGEVLAESRGPTGRPQRVTVRLDERLRRTYLLAHQPSLLARRPSAYRALADGKLQRAFLSQAPPFRFLNRSNRFTVD